MLFAVAPILAFAAAWTRAPDPPPAYTVRPGDTLSRIAWAQLGDAARWPEIAALNGLKAPYPIRIGQRVQLPAKDAAAPGGTPAPDAASPPQENEATLAIPSEALIWALAALAALWLFGAACLRGGCWFSLVDATFGRCALLSLLLAACSVLGAGLLVGVGYLAARGILPPSSVPASSAVLSIAVVLASALIARRVLDCRWRSVVTVLVMTELVGNLAGGALFLVLLAAFPLALQTAAARELLDAVAGFF
jgi:LysM repeat protein